MACSATKLDRVAPAMDLYRGVFYETFRAHVSRDIPPNVVILSARHGFINATDVIAPYEQRMTAGRAEAMLADLPRYTGSVRWPDGASEIFLAGGVHYRRVMRAAVNRLTAAGRMSPQTAVGETSGGIGYQRSQLGNFLQRVGHPGSRVVGHHPNGTELLAELGGFRPGMQVLIAYRARRDLDAVPGIVAELFMGPCGPTACVAVAGKGAQPPTPCWVHVADLRTPHTATA